MKEVLWRGCCEGTSSPSVNKRAVRILLECILVNSCLYWYETVFLPNMSRDCSQLLLIFITYMIADRDNLKMSIFCCQTFRNLYLVSTTNKFSARSSLECVITNWNLFVKLAILTLKIWTGERKKISKKLPVVKIVWCSRLWANLALLVRPRLLRSLNGHALLLWSKPSKVQKYQSEVKYPQLTLDKLS